MTVRSDAALMVRATTLTARAAPGAAVALGTVTVAGALAPVASVWLTKVVVDRLAGGAGAGVTGPAVLFGIVLVVAAVLKPVERLLVAEIDEQAIAAVERGVIDAATRLVDLRRIERPAFQDELKVLQMGAVHIPRTAVWASRLLYVPVTLVGVLALLLGIHPVLPAVLGGVIVAHVSSMGKMGVLRHRAMVRHSRTGRETDYCSRITLEPAGAKEVRVFGLGPFFLDLFRRRAARAVGEMRAVRLAQLRTTVLVAVLHGAVLAGGFVYVARRAAAGGLTAGDVALYLNAAVQAELTAWSLSFLFTYGHEVLLNARVVLPFLDGAHPAVAVDGVEPAPPDLRHGVELAAVSFRYPESERAVLDGVDGLLPAGKVTAVVGANGAGKSTLVKLLTRMYDPDGGVILVDGRALADLDLTSWRASLSAVHQDFARFALTVQENIGVAGATHVEGAASWAGVDEVAARLPHGMDTPLTRQFEGGSDLSGGEWQKVALARGAVRRDAALVILDEPTAGLDPEAEYRLFQRFRELVVGRTALLISHRFSTVRMADHVLVLEDGRVLEAGSHDELVARNGRYAELYEMQAGRYR